MRASRQLRALGLAGFVGWAAGHRAAAQGPGASASDGARALIGLWGCEVSFGPNARGLLTVTREGPGWSATVAGYEVSAQVTTDSVRVRLPDGRGDFRGARQLHPDRVEGFWVQPPGLVAGVPYSTPV